MKTSAPHYLRTGQTHFGEEIVLVSDKYLHACLPSHRESWHSLWSFCAGVFLVNLLFVTLVGEFAFTTQPVLMLMGLLGFAYSFPKWRKLRNSRIMFLRSEKASRVGG